MFKRFRSAGLIPVRGLGAPKYRMLFAVNNSGSAQGVWPSGFAVRGSPLPQAAAVLFSRASNLRISATGRAGLNK